MKYFKLFLIIILLANIIAAITGIKSIQISQNGSEMFQIVHSTGLERIYAIISALIISTFYYGISKRKYTAYIAGWVLLISGFIYIISNLSIIFIKFVYRTSHLSFALPSFCFGIIASIVMLIYGGKWWKSNKDYFIKK